MQGGPNAAHDEQADGPDDEEQEQDQHDTDHAGDVTYRLVETASSVRAALYRGERREAEAIAGTIETDVFEAAALGDAERLRVLLFDTRLAASVSDDGFTALHLAAFLGGPAAVKVLLDAGADPNTVSDNEMRVQPLHSGAANGNVEACELLIAAGADVNGQQAGGWTPLDEAMITKNDALADTLQRAGGELSGNELP